MLFSFMQVSVSARGDGAVLVPASVPQCVSVMAPNPPQITVGCVTAPAGLAAWWRGEGNGNDSAGTNNASVPSGVAYVTAKVGQGFDLEGNTNQILVPDSPALNVGANEDFSIEAWILPLENPGNYTDYSGEIMTVVGKRYAPDLLTALGYEVFLAGGRLSFQMDDNPNEYHNYNAGPDLRDGQFHHVAVTVQRNATNGIAFYVDGQLIANFDPTVTPGDLFNSDPLRIGNHPVPGVAAFYHGVIDEVSLYHRALGSNEVAALYQAGSEGKCSQPVAPEIASSPASQAVAAGGTATFEVVATGTGPLTYQWLFNGKNLAGATNATLVLNAVLTAQAGNYSVKVKSAYGSAVSGQAVLTVITQNVLVYKFAGHETVMDAAQLATYSYSGYVYFSPDTTNGVFVGFGTIQGRKLYWVDPITPAVWTTIPAPGGKSYTLLGDASSGHDSDAQPHFSFDVLKGWNSKLSVGGKKTLVFPETLSGQSTHAAPDAQTGKMRLDVGDSTCTFSGQATLNANNAGETVDLLVSNQVVSLKRQGYQAE